jgi:hypothetical protein
VDFFGELSDKALHFIAYFDPAAMAAAGFQNRRVGFLSSLGGIASAAR